MRILGTHKPAGGFVLPYVLAFLLILSIVTISTANRLIKTSEIVGELRDRSTAELLLQSAESDAVFTILTGNAVERGLDINPSSPVRLGNGFPAGDLNISLGLDSGIEYSDSDIWLANGTFRQATNPKGTVIVSLQDLSGLISLHDGKEEALSTILSHLDVESMAARSLVAKLKDYTDRDENRRFMGAESFDYKARKKTPPSNRPLRTYQEVNLILGWEEAIKKIDFQTFMDLTTLRLTGFLKSSFLPNELRDLLGETPSPSGTEFSSFFAGSEIPSGKYRVSFYVKNSRGAYLKRAIEIWTTAEDQIGPFKSYWVYETPDVRDSAVDEIIKSDYGLKNVIHTSSIHNPRR